MSKQTIRSNFIYNVSYELFRIIVPLITTPYISRVLGAEGIGTYTLAHTYSQYFILFAGLGYATYASRELAYKRDDKDIFRASFWEIFISRVFLMAIAIIVYFIIFFVKSNQIDFSYKICILYLFASIFDFSYYFRAIEDFKAIAIRNFVIKLISLALIFIFVKNSAQVWLYSLILVGSEVFGQGIMVFSLDKSLFRKTSISIDNIKKHFKESVSLFIPALAIQVYGMLDKVMLGFMVGEKQVGYYENAQKMVRLASAIPSAMVAVSTPRVAYDYAKGNIDNIKKHFSKVFKFISFLAFPMCLGLISVAGNFSSWFYGSNFVGIEKLIIPGAILIVSLAWSHLLGNMILIATGNQKYYTIGVYVGAGLNLFMNLALIPKLGALGALLASDVAELSGMIIMFYFSDKIFSLAYNLKYIVTYIFASLVMAIAIAIVADFVPYGILTTCAEIIIGIIVYSIILIILKDDSIKDMWELVKKVFKKIYQKV